MISDKSCVHDFTTHVTINTMLRETASLHCWLQFKKPISLCAWKKKKNWI